MSGYWSFVLIFVLGSASIASADPDRCAVCAALLGDKVFIVTDKVTQEKRLICPDCAKLPNNCFRCGLPVKKDYTALSDGRFLCERDVKNAVLDDDDAKQTIADVQSALDRLFSRFISFPAKNLETAVVDRINLTALFSLPGHDYECPNILGYTQSRTNNGKLQHKISVLSGLPRGELRAVCAHELTHAWVFENIPPARLKTLGSDAHEGFCELVAYLLMNSVGDDDDKKLILQNHYTRGQINAFIEAEDRFGFNEVVEWMKYGQDSVLHKEDLNRIRDVQITRKSPSPATNVLAAIQTYALPPVSAGPAGFVVKGISIARNRPLAMINDVTFEIQEEATIRVSGTNVLVRCVAIRPGGARIRILPSGEERELLLAEH